MECSCPNRGESRGKSGKRSVTDRARSRRADTDYAWKDFCFCRWLASCRWLFVANNAYDMRRKLLRFRAEIGERQRAIFANSPDTVGKSVSRSVLRELPANIYRAVRWLQITVYFFFQKTFLFESKLPSELYSSEKRRELPGEVKNCL